MKICELCEGIARMYCESDQANLCWSCDTKVHSANFLVARHSRRLLCHVCQLPTAWSASGSKLGSTVSACERCSEGSARSGPEAEVSREENRVEDDEDEDDEDDDDEDGDEVEEEDEDEMDSEDIQVVPWSSTPPPPASPSSEDSLLITEIEASVKRLRENDTDLQYEDNRRSLSSQLHVRTPPESSMACRDVNGLKDETCMVNTGRPAKLQRTDPIRMGRVESSESRSSSIVDALGRFNRAEVQSSGDLAEFRRLSEDLTTVDFECSETS